MSGQRDAGFKPRNTPVLRSKRHAARLCRLRDFQRLSISWRAFRQSPLPLIAIILAGCAMQPSAPPPIQIQTRTVEVKVPVAVPCFKEEDRPIMPTPTPINLQTATIDQMAAAIDADALADSIYTASVDRLFLQCQKAGGTP